MRVMMPVSDRKGYSASRAPGPSDAFGGAILFDSEEDMSCLEEDLRGGRRHPT